MADYKKVIEGVKGIGGFAVVVDLLKPLTKFVIDSAKDKIDEKKDLVEIPELYAKGFPLKREQAITVLEKRGFIVEPVAVPISEAKIKYRECFDLQVVGSRPKHKQKVRPGTLIYLQYVTEDVIMTGQKMFQDLEERKVEAKLEKDERRTVQVEKAKEIIDGQIKNLHQGMEHINLKATSQVKKVLRSSKVRNIEEEELK